MPGTHTISTQFRRSPLSRGRHLTYGKCTDAFAREERGVLDEQQNCLCDVLKEILHFQNLIEHTWTKHFNYLLLKIVGSDTIPIALLTRRGTHLQLTDYESGFTTCYFRIENIDVSNNLLTVSFLCPMSIEGEPIMRAEEMVTLKKTNREATINIATLSGVQLFSTSLLSANIFVESKW